MLRSVELHNFKAFERFSARFKPHTVVVGPNNAGKSTLLSAVRLAAGLLNHAKERKPDRSVDFRGQGRLAYGLATDRFGVAEENIPHEFRDVESRVKVTFSRGASLTAVWPRRSDEDA